MTRTMPPVLTLTALLAAFPLWAQDAPGPGPTPEPEKVLPTLYAGVFPPALKTTALAGMLNAEDEKLVNITDAVSRGKLDLEEVKVLLIDATALTRDAPRLATILTDARQLITNFVEGGGVLVVFTRTGNAVTLRFLPGTMTARLSEEHHDHRVAIDPAHPLLSGAQKLTARDLGSTTGWLYHGGCYAEYSRLVPVVAYDRRGRYPIILEGSAGKGRVLLVHLSPIEAMARGDAAEKRSAERLLANLLAYVRKVLAGEIAEAKPVGRRLRVTVYEDANANGRRDPGEKPLTDVPLAGTRVTPDARGRLSLTLDAYSEFVHLDADLARYVPPFWKRIPVDATQLDVGLVPRKKPLGDVARVAYLIDAGPAPEGEDVELAFMLAQIARVVPKVDVLAISGPASGVASRAATVRSASPPFDVIHSLLVTSTWESLRDVADHIAQRDAFRSAVGPDEDAYRLHGRLFRVTWLAAAGVLSGEGQPGFRASGLGAPPRFAVFDVPRAGEMRRSLRIAGIDRMLVPMFPAGEATVAPGAFSVSVAAGDAALGRAFPVAVKLAHVRRKGDGLELVPLAPEYKVTAAGELTRRIAFTKPAALSEGFYVMRLLAGDPAGRHWRKTVSFVVPRTAPAKMTFGRPWRDVGGGPLHTGEAAATLDPPLTLAGVTHTGVHVLQGCPVVTADNAIVPPNPSAPARYDEAGHVTFRGDHLLLESTGEKTGTFRFDVAGAFVTPEDAHLLSAGDFLCMLDAAGKAWGFKRTLGAPVAADGDYDAKAAAAAQRWHRTIAPGCRLAVATDLFLYTGNECLETATGMLQWRLEKYVLRDVHVALSGKHVVVTGVTAQTTARGLSPKGTVPAHPGTPAGDSPLRGQSPQTHLARQVLLVVRRDSGKIVWEQTLAAVRPLDDVTTPPPAVARGAVFVGSADGVFRAFRLEDGDELWRFQTGSSVVPLSAGANRWSGRIASQAIVSGRWVWVAAADGRLYALDRRRGTLRWHVDVGLPVVASPALSGNVLCLTDWDGNVYTFVALPGR